MKKLLILLAVPVCMLLLAVGLAEETKPTEETQQIHKPYYSTRVDT